MFQFLACVAIVGGLFYSGVLQTDVVRVDTRPIKTAVARAEARVGLAVLGPECDPPTAFHASECLRLRLQQQGLTIGEASGVKDLADRLLKARGR